MYAKLIAPSLLAAAFVAVPCFANPYADGEVGYIPPPPTGSMTTREAVVAEYMKTLEAQPVPPPSTLARDTVVAELLRAQRDGTMPPNGEGADTGAVAERRPDPMDARPTLAAR